MAQLMIDPNTLTNHWRQKALELTEENVVYKAACEQLQAEVESITKERDALLQAKEQPTLPSE